MKIFISHSVRDHELVASIETFLRDDGHELFDSATDVGAGDFLSEISAAIRSADAVIAVVSEGNPNIFYELGLAVGASVPILIVAPTTERLPADLVSVPFVPTTGDILRDAQTIARRTNELRSLSSAKPKEFESAEANLRAAVEEPAVMEALRPSDFEKLVIELFKEKGYQVADTSSDRDAGVDFIIESNKEKERVAVEVKKLNRQSLVSVEAVRRLLLQLSSLKTPLGMLVATSGFTAAALALAAGTPVLLRTLDEVLAAKSVKDLLETESHTN